MSILQLSWRRRRKTKPAHHLVAKRFSHTRLCDFARCAFGPDWRGRRHFATAIERALHRLSFTFSIGCSDSPDTERASRRRRVVRKLSRRGRARGFADTLAPIGRTRCASAPACTTCEIFTCARTRASPVIKTSRATCLKADIQRSFLNSIVNRLTNQKLEGRRFLERCTSMVGWPSRSIA